MDVFQSIFISRHPAETSVSGVFGIVPWQLVSCSQQVLLEDKQDVSRAEGVHTAVLHGGSVVELEGSADSAANVCACTQTHTRTQIKKCKVMVAL